MSKKEIFISTPVDDYSMTDESQHITPKSMTNRKNVLSQISRIYEKLVSLKYLHSQSASDCILRQKLISFPARIISSLVGSGSAMNLILNYQTFDTSNYIIAILTILGSILSLTDSFVDYNTRVLKHEFYKSSLVEITNEIETKLSIDNIRDHSRYLEKITQKLSHLSNGGSPPFTKNSHKKLKEELERLDDKDFEVPLSVHKLKYALEKSLSPRKYEQSVCLPQIQFSE